MQLGTSTLLSIALGALLIAAPGLDNVGGGVSYDQAFAAKGGNGKGNGGGNGNAGGNSSSGRRSLRNGLPLRSAMHPVKRMFAVWQADPQSIPMSFLIAATIFTWRRSFSLFDSWSKLRP